VDVGCGRGEAAVHAARRGARVIALDFSLDALALCRLSARRDPDAVVAPDRLSVAASEATALPVAGGWAGRVLMLDVVEHLQPWQVGGALREARRILRPDGYVVIHTLPNRWALRVAYPVLRPFARRLPRDGRSEYERQVHVNEQDPLRLRRALREAGLANRVWVEEWTTRHASRGRGLGYPDALREHGYPLLARPVMRRLARRVMATPLRWLAANDLFALAWLPGSAGPPQSGRFRAVR